MWKVYYTELEKVKANIIAKVKQFPYFSQSNLWKLFVDNFWWNVIYHMVVLGRPLHWGTIIILHFIGWRMNPQKQQQQQQQQQ